MIELEIGKWSVKDGVVFREILEYRHNKEGQRLFFTDGTQLSINWDHDIEMLIPGNFFVVSKDNEQTACSNYFGDRFLEIRCVAND